MFARFFRNKAEIDNVIAFSIYDFFLDEMFTLCGYWNFSCGDQKLHFDYTVNILMLSFWSESFPTAGIILSGSAASIVIY